MNLRAFIFDMDGLLINSEPYWRKAEIDVFSSYGVSLRESDCEAIMGMRLDVVVRHFCDQHQIDAKPEQIEHDIVERMDAYIKADGSALPGVYDLLDLADSLGVRIALASSSPMLLIQTTVDRLNIRKYFQFIASAEDDEFGKPDPAVYLRTALELDVKPEYCLVFEDSEPGVTAALAAGMNCIAVPEATIDKPIFKSANDIVQSLEQVDKHYLFRRFA